ncbi:MAG: nuclear transport factor 2 family protein [Comamonadaceae bacterium]|jgi:ketosteroid isomerase-like protein|uniref:nuclear transport factor 2 family protein n=1 Tax=Hydrogenophaga sp. SNF1 TaxID=3098762 RepID=UPI002ACC08BA|nr:nuclear transport factor 2 family protein [Hydrogenophaga sp. SNF1]NCT96161.1 nuclear transport factor 2 family protein [Comamonadaceae bacterium]WQB81594.1 nuclear transport factor 2 family protein [Hydrogenophaga sp. SNF1]
MTPLEHARELIERFIRAVNNGDADAAQRCLTPDVQLVFPGPTRFQRVADFLALSGPRYQRVAYTYGAMELAQSHQGHTVVFAQGTVSGVFANGQAFDGVRYIDRFDIDNGLIASKEVWSDMADRMRRLGV